MKGIIKKSLLIAALFLSTVNAALANAQTIKVGTMGTYEPFSYHNENGELVGYDIEVLREVAKRDASLQFEFIASPWDTLFPGLDANRFQLLAQQLTSNRDRVRRYYLTDNRYFTCVSQLIVKAGRNDIHSLADLKGKKIGMTVGDSFTRLVEDWNNEHGNILTIVYYEQDIPTILQDIATGRIDATVNDPIMAKSKAAKQNLNIRVVGEPLAADPTFFVMKKDAAGNALKQRIDSALQAMHDDGTLSRLSVKYFATDYTR
ncbi:transporter substrate-binding domain-containing protein [Serratia microhaemolytica]|uniref:transporter substrate-binding domain-containing protein n=1 Tax=Serratia microhaemolytica TaxID=2675110 RepID=UPI000FDD18F9|nr:transporter substrate-binding domain-containing protein [Serratia microhaemolytica]